MTKCYCFRNIRDKDVFSKSDPVCVLFMKHHNSWQEIGRTEMIKDTVNPQWVKRFEVDYRFEERQVKIIWCGC